MLELDRETPAAMNKLLGAAQINRGSGPIYEEEYKIEQDDLRQTPAMGVDIPQPTVESILRTEVEPDQPFILQTGHENELEPV